MPKDKTYVGPKAQKKLDKAEKQNARKHQLAQSAAESNAAIQEERNKQAQKSADDKIKKDKLRGTTIANARNNWNIEIDRIVDKVLGWRNTSPNSGINAGNNAGGLNCAGGNNNALHLPLPVNNCDVTWGDVFATVQGHDQSDSALFKVRRRGVLVHVSP